MRADLMGVKVIGSRGCQLARSLLINAVAQIGDQAHQWQERGFATPCGGMVKSRTPRVVMT